MKTLIVDDDFTNRVLLQAILGAYGPTHIAVNGKEGIDAVGTALGSNEPYDLVCLDIMMPEMDGQEALKIIRNFEEKSEISPGEGVKIIMTTALDDSVNVMTSFREQCDGYITKPIDKELLLQKLNDLELITWPEEDTEEAE